MLLGGKCHDRNKQTNKQTNRWGSALGGECHSGNRNNPVLPTDLVITHLQRGFSNKQTEKKQKQIWKYDLDTSKVAVYYHTSREVFSNKQTEKKTETDLKIWSWHIKSCSFIKLRLREAGQEHFDSTNIVRDVIFNMWYRHMVTKTCYQSSTLCIVMLT